MNDYYKPAENEEVFPIVCIRPSGLVKIKKEKIEICKIFLGVEAERVGEFQFTFESWSFKIKTGPVIEYSVSLIAKTEKFKNLFMLVNSRYIYPFSEGNEKCFLMDLRAYRDIFDISELDVLQFPKDINSKDLLAKYPDYDGICVEYFDKNKMF